MAKFDWNTEAAAMAAYVAREMFEAHRGAMPWRQVGIQVIFGNDGWRNSGYKADFKAEGDPRTHREVALVRETLEAEGIDILGFGSGPADDEYGPGHFSWAMLVRSDDLELLTSVVWQAWEIACEGHGEIDTDLVITGGVQPAIAAGAIYASGLTPDHSAN
jgi:hypothetical protein